MAQLTSFFALQGGLNLVTPAIRTPSGHAIAGINYEPVERGYRRIDGYERFDGRPKPSDASYWVLNYDAGSVTIAEGNVVTGLTSGAVGEALVDMVISTGTVAGSNAAGYIVLFNVVGTFQDNEALQVSGVTRATANGTAVEGNAATDANDTLWTRAAIEATRADILVVAGSGRIRGVWVDTFGTKYAFRDNTAITACIMWRSTTAGWTEVDLGYSLKYDAGTAFFDEGDAVVGATSGATGVITRVAKRIGSYDDGDAAGLLTFATINGTFTDGEILQVNAVDFAIADGDSEANVLPPGGRYEFVNHNFFGASDLARIYGCNGEGTAFEYDGTVFVPIVTGMEIDKPEYIAQYKNHLFLFFPGGSVQNSGIGDPYSWTAVTGASEIAVGQDITGVCMGYAKSMVVFCRNKIVEWFGNDITDFVVETLSDIAGGIAHTAQLVGVPIYMDDGGLRDLRTTAAYGDYKLGTVSRMIEPLIRQKKAAGVTPTASIRSRAKDQYRVFFDDDTGVTVYVGRKAPELMPFDLGLTVWAACSAEDAAGNEIMFFGSDDGYVYQFDAGTSLDGDQVNAYLRLPFNHVGSPTQYKRWHQASLEVDADPTVNLHLSAEYSYGAVDSVPSAEIEFDVSAGGGFWDQDNWNEFFWSSPVEGTAVCALDGYGTNVSLLIVSQATYEQPHTLHGLVIHYSPRGLKRGSSG